MNLILCFPNRFFSKHDQSNSKRIICVTMNVHIPMNYATIKMQLHILSIKYYKYAPSLNVLFL